MQFVPLWTSILRSKKVFDLPDDLFRTWALFLLSAQEHDHRSGSLPRTEDLAHSLHLDEKECLSRLSRLSRDGFLDECEGVFTIHDWDDWKVRKDFTGAERKRRQREKDKDKKRLRKMSNGADVTVCHGTSRDVTNVTMSRPNSTTTASIEEGTHSPFVPILTPRQKECIDLAAARWGTQNGDSFIGDLLKTYTPEIVMESMDAHWDSVGPGLKPRLLRAICAGKFNDQQKGK